MVAQRLKGRLAQVRRDLFVVFDGLRGRHPAPLVDRGPRAPAAERQMATVKAARLVTVAERTLETRDAVSLILVDPAGAPIEFVPGQFFTVLVEIGGRTYRRAYSASASHRRTDALRLTIKRVAGGRVSNHLVDAISAGDQLRILGPSGEFTYQPDADAARNLVLIGGGSGITPLMSIALAALDDPGNRVTLIYGNSAIEDIIFLYDIEKLAADHGDRMTARLLLERPPVGWPGGAGRLDSETVARELAALPASELPTSYYVCGPEPMMTAVRDALTAAGVADDAIRVERFASPELRSEQQTPVIGAVQQVQIRLGGVDHEVAVEPGQTLLDAGLAAGLPMKFSCAMGGCGACKVRLTDGDVVMDGPTCLTPAEREGGYVLACVGRPTCASTIEAD